MVNSRHVYRPLLPEAALGQLRTPFGRATLIRETVQPHHRVPPGRRDLLLQSLTDFGDDGVLVGEAAGLQLAIDEVVADGQLEAAAGRGLKHELADSPL